MIPTTLARRAINNSAERAANADRANRKEASRPWCMLSTSIWSHFTGRNDFAERGPRGVGILSAKSLR
jgi:hypothetical protein